MMRILLGLVFVTMPAWAQLGIPQQQGLPQQQGPSPSQVAVDIVGNISIMARTMESQTREIQALQAQVKQLQDELNKLKAEK